MNLIKLYTHHGPVYVDTAQLNSERKLCTMYTRTGRKLSEAGRTAEIREQAAHGVHRANLYASPELAEADRARIYEELTK